MSAAPNRIKPSDAFRVRGDTPISECVALMNRENIGSLLVMSRENPDHLIGIFTERDLLRNIDLIHTGGYWDFAVSSVMSRPVVTVEPTRLDEAAVLMLEHGFRHLPVLEPLPNGERRLCGVVSMRDLLRANVLRPVPRPASANPDAPLPTLGLRVQTQDPRFKTSLFRILGKLIKHAELTEGEAPHEIAVVDADGLAPSELAQSVRESLQREQTRAILLIHSPGTIPAPALKALMELGSAGKLAILPKPLNLLALSDMAGRISLV